MLQSATNLVGIRRPKGPLYRFVNVKKAFPPLPPPCNVVPLFELPVEDNKRHNFECRGGGRMEGVSIVLLSEVTPFKNNI